MAFSDRIDIALSGGCQCGAVRYHATQRLDNAHICHCRMCQKAVGNFFAPLVGLPLDRLTWTRGTPSIFMSSAEVERGFCNQCGTPLFYHHVKGKHLSVTIGSLDHPELVTPIIQVGNESRLPYAATLGALPGDTTTEEDDAEGVERIRLSNHQHPDHDTAEWPQEGTIMSDVRITGGCQCGAVRYALHKVPERPCICYCRMCQKSSGNILATFAGVETKFFELTRGELSVFQTSDKGERCFCNQCGTPLAWRDREDPWISVTIGSLDHPEAVRPNRFYGEEGRISWVDEVVTTHGIPTGGGADSDWPLEEIYRTNRQHPDHDTTVWPPHR